MKKNCILLALTLCLIIFPAAQAFAVKVKCKVQSIHGTVVVFDCGKKAKRLKVGTSATVTSKKKDGGC